MSPIHIGRDCRFVAGADQGQLILIGPASLVMTRAEREELTLRDAYNARPISL